MISEDFEAVLILLPASARQKIIQQLDQSTTDGSDESLRDGILRGALETDAQNAKAAIDESDSALNDTQAAVETLNDARFLAVGEVGMMRQDMQTRVDELVMARQRAFHEYVVAAMQADILDQKAPKLAVLTRGSLGRTSYLNTTSEGHDERDRPPKDRVCVPTSGPHGGLGWSKGLLSFVLDGCQSRHQGMLSRHGLRSKCQRLFGFRMVTSGWTR